MDRINLLVKLLHDDVCGFEECAKCPFEFDDTGCIARMVDRMAKHFEENDVIPVVRCKDCRHMTVELGYRYCNVWERINGYGDDGFCSYGERKEDVAVATDDEEPEEDYCAACEITYSWEKEKEGDTD